MKIFLIICLASGLASSEKLDRSYLPPPGSKYSGGSPGDIQVPLEFPKETYSTTRPQITDDKPDIDLGINRRPASPTGVPESQKPGFTYFQNSYPVPKTTTSYAITQTTTFPPAGDYEGLDQPVGFINDSTGIQSASPGQTYQQQPIRRPGQGTSFNQYRPPQDQSSTVAPYGTTTRPLFPGLQKGLEYLPPISSSGYRGKPGQVISSQDGFGYPAGQPQGSKYQDGQLSGPTINPPGYVSRGSNQQNQFAGNQNIPSLTAAPQHQDGRFELTGPGSQQFQNQLPENQYPSSTTVPQYQGGQRFSTPGSNQPNKFLGNQNFPSSTSAHHFQSGQRFTTPGLDQEVIGVRVPNQQNQYTENQFQGNQNFPSSTISPAPGSVEQSQFPGNQNFPSTAAPNYQESLTNPGQIQGGLIPGQQTFGSRLPNQQSQNQYVGKQNFPTSITPQLQDSQRFTTPGYKQDGYEPPAHSQQNQNQYPGNQNFPSSTTRPQYQNGQSFTTPGPIRQNQYPSNTIYPSTATPNDQDGQRHTTPSQYTGGLIPGQHAFGSRLPTTQQNQNQNAGNQNQYAGNQNFPSSTVAPQYQHGQGFTTPGSQQIFDSPQHSQPNQYPGNEQFPSSTSAPQYQDGQLITTTGAQQRFEPPQFNQHNRYPGSQIIPSSTTAPQSQGQHFNTPGQQVLPNQHTYPGSTSAPQYQQTLSPTSGTNQQGFIPNQQNQYQRPTYNQVFPSSTAAPQAITSIPMPQYGDDGIQNVPGTAVSIPQLQSELSGSQTMPTYGNIQQPTSQTVAGSSVYGTAPSVPSQFSNQAFSSTAGPLPARDYFPTPGSGNLGVHRPERPQAESDRNAEILNYENVLTPEGYSYSYDTSNGIHADETGTVGDGTRAQGGFSYTGDDGKVYSIFYSADENGFQPRGDHLPTPPPIPEAIQRVIDQANKDKESGIDDDGSYNEDKYGYMKYEGPLTHMRPRNRTVSTVNGADIPDVIKTRVGGQSKKVLKPNKDNSGEHSEADVSDKYESQSEPESEEIDANEEQLGNNNDVNLNGRKENPKYTESKQPKPIKNLTVEDKRLNRLRGNKTPMKSNINFKSDFMQNEDSSHPVESTKENEEISSGDASVADISEEQKNSDDLDEGQYSPGIDYDTDLVNYQDDPNNRTDFHGLNRYLPKPKSTNRKNQLKQAKKRPMMQVGGTNRPHAGLNKADKSRDRNNQASQDVEPDFVDEPRTRIPSRKNKIGQKITGQSKISQKPGTVRSDEEFETYDDDRYNTEEYGSDEEMRLATSMGKPGTSQSRKKIPGKPKGPTVIESTGMYDSKNIKPTLDEETGYEYTPPQRKFESGGAMRVPSRTLVSKNKKNTQNAAPTTLRPFMTKNVYGDDNEPTEEDINQYGAIKPDHSSRPTMAQTQLYPGFNQDSDRYKEKPNPEVNEDQKYTVTGKPVSSYRTTPSRRPFGRPQTTTMSRYDEQNVTGEPASIQGPQRPGDKVFYNTNSPSRGSIFSSTTPLPSSQPDTFKYQRPAYYDETISPGSETFVNRPGANRPIPQVPSTTYRPNFSFGDRTLAPSGPVAVDGFGRPIPSTQAPAFDGTLRPTYSTARPTVDGLGRPNAGGSKPTAGHFGVTSPTQGAPRYPSTTSATLGEDFSGPKQPQRFDPESGYYYK